MTEKNSDAIGILWDITGMVLRGRACAQEGMCDDVMGMPLAVFWPMEMEGSLGISKNNLPTSPQLLGATNCPKGGRLVPNAEKPRPSRVPSLPSPSCFFLERHIQSRQVQGPVPRGRDHPLRWCYVCQVYGRRPCRVVRGGSQTSKKLPVLPAPLGSCDVGPVPWEDYRTMTTTTE